MDKSMGERLVLYQKLRAIHKDLHHTLMNQLPHNALQECGKLLGVYKNDTLVLNSESEMAALMDYCIYDYRWDGRNVIERYIDQTNLEAGIDRMNLLTAMLASRYSIFVVDEIVKGAGIQTRDVFTGDSSFIMDVGMSETAVKHLVFACRTIAPGDCGFSMATSGVLLADRSILEKVIKRFSETKVDIAKLSSQKPAEFAASIIRVFLEGNASHGIAFSSHSAEVEASPRIGRNEPCPCGSGKKYKKCCGLN